MEWGCKMKEEFEIIRKNALANPNLYNGRYTQKNKKDAYIEFLEDRLMRLERERDSESLKKLLEDLKVEVESWISEMRDRESFCSTEYYKSLYGRIEEELKFYFFYFDFPIIIIPIS